MNDAHITRLAADYVLDLLPPATRRQVERHAAQCPACRAAIRRERQVGLAVHQTLNAVARLPHGRLSPPRPPSPRRWGHGARRSSPGWSMAPLTLAGLLLVLFFSFSSFNLAPAGWPGQTMTAYAATPATAVIETSAANGTAVTMTPVSPAATHEIQMRRPSTIAPLPAETPPIAAVTHSP